MNPRNLWVRYKEKIPTSESWQELECISTRDCRGKGDCGIISESHTGSTIVTRFTHSQEQVLHVP